MSTAVTETGAGLPAAGSSFYLGMRILPKEQREGMYAVYAFCRVVDDIADDEGARTERLAGLERWRDNVDAVYRGEDRPATEALAPVIRRFGLPRHSFHDVIDGMEMDVRDTIVAPDWPTLDLYCDRVASAVGRLSCRIFGLGEEEGDRLAHHLGRALQLTNILRDIDEDAAIGRLYLPREALQRAGIADLQPLSVAADPMLPDVCREVADRAREHFVEADRIMSAQPKRLVRAPRIMGAAYRSVLDRLLRRGFVAPRVRVGTSKLTVIGAAIRYALP